MYKKNYIQMEIIFLLKIEEKKTKFCNVNIEIIVTVVDELNLIHLCLKFDIKFNTLVKACIW